MKRPRVLITGICGFVGSSLALELKQQIRAPVRVGDTVHGEIEIVSVRPTSQGNRGIVVSRIEVKNQHDEIVMTYEATRMLAGRDEAIAQTAESICRCD